MICRLCLNDVENYFDFFSEKGKVLNAAKIISQHFWFEVEGRHKLLSYIKSDPFEEKPNVISNSKSVNNIKNKLDIIDNSVNSCFDGIKLEVVSGESANIHSSNIQLTSNDCQYIDNENRKLRYRGKKLSLVNDKIKQSDLVVKSFKIKKENQKKNLSPKNLILKKVDKIQPGIVKRKNEFFSDEQIREIKTLNCNSCYEKISTFSKLKKHMNEVHGENGYVVCCERKFYKRYKFVNHLQAHLNPDEFKCPHCDKRLASKRNVKLHIKNMHTEIGKLKNFRCDQCEKTFAQKAYLDRHKLGHIPDSEKHFACEKCGNRFPTPALLRVHTVNVHESRHSSICDLCGKKYKSSVDLKRHRLEHMGIHEPKVQCEICSDWLSNKYKLKRHMLKHTTADSEHRCPICNKMSGNLLALKSHMRLHIAPKKFQCSICQKGFRRSLSLKEHMTTHTGETLYSCTNCSRTFTHHSNLHHHRKKMHPRELEEDRKLRHLKTENYNTLLGTLKLDIVNNENSTQIVNTAMEAETKTP
ncbi:transcription factor grauzone-like isoform X2 [Condylostylus longicornis]|uniref:transcription factor grauzone-like isoform X2 n=1 Tax=Condylostylus longicornis TaxID=2530218 RepID=UPI00244E4B2F|nr:transcription factor grauzone-like isoform X2 [Condylostylus longicornis]